MFKINYNRTCLRDCVNLNEFLTSIDDEILSKITFGVREQIDSQTYRIIYNQVKTQVALPVIMTFVIKK